MKEKTLSQLYWGDMMSQREIAETRGVSQRTIGRWMKEEGVATRARIEACRTERSRKKSSDSKKGEKHPQFGKRGEDTPMYGRTGEDSPNWKGGRKMSGDGYILIYSPTHPNTSNKNYVYEHRLVMEKKLGRYLTKEEVVHHNKGRTDNLPEDLRLFKNGGDHQRYEFALKRLNKMSADLG